MNRVARQLRKHIEQRVDSFAAKSDLAAGLGVGTFVFLMVLREGAELALILRAVELSSEGLAFGWAPAWVLQRRSPWAYFSSRAR